MENKNPDEILYDKMRNYCLAPWKSTRQELPPYGVPVLMAWHHDRSSSDADINGFLGYSFGVGARFYYEEITEVDKKTTIINSHLGDHLSYDNFRMMNEGYRVGLDDYNRWISYTQFVNNSSRRAHYGISDPYLRSKKDLAKEKETQIDGKIIKRYDYWVNFAEGKYGSYFNNPHAADLSFIPESTVNKVLKDESKQPFRYEQLILNAEDSIYAKYPDYWMLIPRLK